MTNSDLEKPMGNAELRIRLKGIDDKLGILLDPDEGLPQQKKRLNWLEKGAYICLGAIPLLTIWAGWLTKVELDHNKNDVPITQVQAAVENALAARLEVVK